MGGLRGDIVFMSKIIQFFKSYWYLLFIGIFILIISYSNNKLSDEVKVLQEDLKILEESLNNKTDELEVVENKPDYDPEVHAKVIRESSVSAEAIGKDIIAYDNELTELMRIPAEEAGCDDSLEESCTDDDMTAEELAEYEAELQDNVDRLNKTYELKDKLLAPDCPNESWQLNPNWTLKLESIINYRSTSSFPIVFSMTTANGEKAGIVMATFSVDDYKLSNVNIHYTSVGLNDTL